MISEHTVLIHHIDNPCQVIFSTSGRHCQSTAPVVDHVWGAPVSHPEDLRHILPIDILPGEIIGILQIYYHIFKTIAPQVLGLGSEPSDDVIASSSVSPRTSRMPEYRFSWMGQLAIWDLVPFHSTTDASDANMQAAPASRSSSRSKLRIKAASPLRPDFLFIRECAAGSYRYLPRNVSISVL